MHMTLENGIKISAVTSFNTYYLHPGLRNIVRILLEHLNTGYYVRFQDINYNTFDRVKM